MSRKKPAVLGDEKTTEAQTSLPGVVSAYAHSGMRGWRHHMEDAVVAEQITPALSCFAVFDGHGGDHCARWAARELPRRCRALLTAAGGLSADVRRPLAELMLEMDVELRSHGRLSWHCGATAVVLLVTAEEICLANLGDSRAVLCRGSRAVALSRDHKPQGEPDAATTLSTSALALAATARAATAVAAATLSVANPNPNPDPNPSPNPDPNPDPNPSPNPNPNPDPEPDPNQTRASGRASCRSVTREPQP